MLFKIIQSVDSGERLVSYSVAYHESSVKASRSALCPPLSPSLCPSSAPAVYLPWYKTSTESGITLTIKTAFQSSFLTVTRLLGPHIWK